MKVGRTVRLASCTCKSCAGRVPASGTYQSPEDFLAETFPGDVPAAQILWLKGDIRETSTDIMGHRYPGIRVRYWLQGTRSAWILEEIGKERPITTGLVINAQGIERLRVLVFRESRGWEVKHPFFTDQFPGIPEALRRREQETALAARRLDDRGGFQFPVNKQSAGITRQREWRLEVAELSSVLALAHRHATGCG